MEQTLIRIGIARENAWEREPRTLYKIARKNEFKLIDTRTHSWTTGDLEDIKAFCKAQGLTLVPTNRKGREIMSNNL